MSAAAPLHARVGAVVYVLDLPRLAAFYAAVLGLAQRHADDTHAVLQSPDFQLVLHAIPPAIARDIRIAVPPVAREDTPIKLFFTVDALARAQAQVRRLGGVADAPAWDGPGFHAADVLDPEGNVLQLREPRPLDDPA